MTWEPDVDSESQKRRREYDREQQQRQASNRDHPDRNRRQQVKLLLDSQGPRHHEPFPSKRRRRVDEVLQEQNVNRNRREVLPADREQAGHSVDSDDGDQDVEQNP